uniref:Uncharacterized protein n=1 Tax=Clastoptera arizonana TaxID=38151 RepID=A0A1B6CDB2_9HEMI
MTGGHSPGGTPTASPVPVVASPKWPLRPGVLVHVNTSHSLSLGRLGTEAHKSPQRPLTHRRQRRANSLANISNESQRSRAKRIRQMFSGELRAKYRCDAMPGVYHGNS